MYEEEQILKSIDLIMSYFHKAVKTGDISKTGDPDAAEYTSFDDYIRDLRSRLTVVSYYLTKDLLYDSKVNERKYELRSKIIQAEKQLEYQDEARGEGYSKSQSETVGRKRAEKDKDYIDIQEHYNDSYTKSLLFNNLKWQIGHTLHAMAQYTKTNFS